MNIQHKLWNWVKRRLTFDAKMVKHGVLFLSFFLVLFTINTSSASSISFWIFEIPVIPIDAWIISLAKILSFIISFVFLVSVFLKCLSNYFNNRLETPIFQLIYWIVFIFIYFLGLFRGIQFIPHQYSAWVLLVGLIWLAIIFALVIKSGYQLSKVTRVKNKTV